MEAITEIIGTERRIDKVLHPDFIKNLGALDETTILGRLQEAEQEEADLSYARRLVQGRSDILRAGIEPGDTDIVAALVAALSEERTDNPSRTRHNEIEPSRVGEHRRRAEALVSDVSVSNPGQSTHAVTEILKTLHQEERALSRQRKKVQKVVNALAGSLDPDENN